MLAGDGKKIVIDAGDTIVTITDLESIDPSGIRKITLYIGLEKDKYDEHNIEKIILQRERIGNDLDKINHLPLGMQGEILDVINKVTEKEVETIEINISMGRKEVSKKEEVSEKKETSEKMSEIIKACEEHTYTIDIKNLCIEIQSDPQVTEICKKHTYTKDIECLCIKIQSDTQVTQACRKYTYTTGIEHLCIEIQSDPRVTEVCRKHTSTTDIEHLCIEIQSDPEITKACGKITHKEKQRRCIRKQSAMAGI